jgi:hypothetical protein
MIYIKIYNEGEITLKGAFKTGKIKYTVFISMITVAFVFVCIFYMFGVGFVLEEDNKVFFNEVADEAANSFESRLMMEFNSLNDYSRDFAGFEYLEQAERVEVLDYICGVSGFHDLAYIDLEGNAVSAKTGVAVNLNLREYFRYASLGVPSVSELLSSEFNGDSVYAFAVPVYTGDTITGVLAGVHTEHQRR